MENEINPYGKIDSNAKLGKLIRARRKESGLTQKQIAALNDVGTRFISDVENGKPTVEMGKVLQLLQGIGLEMHVLRRGWQAKVTADD